MADRVSFLDDYSRYISSSARQGIAQQCPERVKTLHKHEGEDVTDTLDLAWQASGCDQVHVVDSALSPFGS